MTKEQKLEFVEKFMAEGTERINALVDGLPEQDRLPASLLGSFISRGLMQSEVLGISDASRQKVLDFFIDNEKRVAEVLLALADIPASQAA